MSRIIFPRQSGSGYSKILALTISLCMCDETYTIQSNLDSDTIIDNICKTMEIIPEHLKLSREQVIRKLNIVKL